MLLTLFNENIKRKQINAVNKETCRSLKKSLGCETEITKIFTHYVINV